MTANSTDFGARFARVSARLLRWLGLPPPDGEDVVQEAWLRAFKALGENVCVLEEPPLFVYLATAAKHVCWRRARKSRDAYEHVAARLSAADDGDLAPGEVMLPALSLDDDAEGGAAAENLERVYRALAALDVEQRLRLGMCKLYGMPSVEVGRALGCSPSSVDNSNLRARARLNLLFPSLGTLGGEPVRPGTLWRVNDARVDLVIAGDPVRATGKGSVLTVRLRGKGGCPLPQVPECWAIVHYHEGGAIGAPTRALWTADAGTCALQVPMLGDGAMGEGVGEGSVREVFVFAGRYLGA